MIDQLSLSILQIRVFINQGFGGSATGFIIKKNNQLYLVTNWHVVAGRNQDDGELNSFGAEPTHLEAIGRDLKLSIDLYDKAGNKKWLEYPVLKTLDDSNIKVPEVDVVLLPIQGVNLPIFELEKLKKNMIIVPAQPISIIGFPFEDSIKLSNGYPVWITGFIASEPNINIQNKPLLYINAAGYSGLSGSPVIVRTFGTMIDKNGNFFGNQHHYDEFVGIYSGRVPTNRKNDDSNKDDLVICRVWKSEVIQQILDQKVLK